MSDWSSSTLVFVRDVGEAIGFYVERLGFTLNMRHEEDGRTLVAGISRGSGCGLLLTAQWPERVGTAILYTHLPDDALERLLAELRQQGLVAKDGWWGTPLAIIEDPDGNQLFFPRADDAQPAEG